jgi:DNA-binding LytR/AlgR family response regulator
MTKLKAIVVEDERLPRMALVQKLETYHSDSVEIIDQCGDYHAAFASIIKNRPDLLFLDIQLQGKTSLDLLKALKESIPLPYIIFTTAYINSEYLLEAIKFSASDYLIKPISLEDLSAAISRVGKRVAVKGSSYDNGSSVKYPLKAVNGTVFVGREDVAYVRSDGNYSNIYLMDGRSELILERLGAIEQVLGSSDFIRAGRNTILNRSTIYKIDKRHKICILKSPAGKEFEVDLSAGGIEALV